MFDRWVATWTVGSSFLLCLLASPVIAQPNPTSGMLANTCAYNPADYGAPPQAESVNHVGGAGPSGKWAGLDIWFIQYPNVKSSRTQYPSIHLGPNDLVYASACGCVQTGGSGLTWKRYVDPSGPKSDHLYRGLIGFGTLNAPPKLMTLQKFMETQGSAFSGLGSGVKANTTGQDEILYLGYQDDHYSDNGYYSHDNGTGSQCSGLFGAAVMLWISRSRS